MQSLKKWFQRHKKSDTPLQIINDLKSAPYSDEFRDTRMNITLDYPVVPKSRAWSGTPGINKLQGLIECRRDTYRQWLTKFAALHEYYRTWTDIPCDEFSPSICNTWFSGLDAVVLYGMLSTRNPKSYIEIGSGESTKIARQAIKDHKLRTKIVSIDPNPREIIDSLCDYVVRAPFEDSLNCFFSSLSPGDVILMDGSHRCFQNSDVTVFFTEALPGLPEDVIYGIHDIFLLGDYPPDWENRFYSEQYVLVAYLLGGAGGDNIELPLKYISEDPELSGVAKHALKSSVHAEMVLDGSSFWLHRPKHS